MTKPYEQEREVRIAELEQELQLCREASAIKEERALKFKAERDALKDKLLTAWEKVHGKSYPQYLNPLLKELFENE